MTIERAARPRRGDTTICAIVTGAANGAGERFARALAASGARLVLVDRDEIALARLRHDLDAVGIVCDVLCDEGVGGMFDVAEEQFGHVDLLINAAGTGYIRTLGVMRASREFARRPRERKAFIVNVAANPDPDNGPFSYAGSEIAFNRLSSGLADSIQGPELRVLTLDRVELPEAIADLVDQLCRQIVGDKDEEGTARAARC